MTQLLLAGVLKRDYPEVEESARFLNGERTFFKNRENSFYENKIYYTNSNLFIVTSSY